MKEAFYTLIKNKWFWIIIGSIIFIYIIFEIITSVKKSTIEETEVKFTGIKKLENFNIQSFLSDSEIKTEISADLTNKQYGGTFSGLIVKVFYQDTEIAHTSSELSNKNLQFDANGKLHISDEITIIMNDAGKDFVLKMIQGKEVPIDYKVKLKIWGFSKTIKNTIPFSIK